MAQDWQKSPLILKLPLSILTTASLVSQI